METADVNVKPVSFDSNIVASLQDEGPRQGDGESRVTFQDPNLHPDHYRYFFNRRPDQAMACRLDKSCPYKVEKYQLHVDSGLVMKPRMPRLCLKEDVREGLFYYPADKHIQLHLGGYLLIVWRANH